MGICFGSLSKVSSLSRERSPPPPPPPEEIYKDLKTYLCESHDWANELQLNFAKVVIKIEQNIKKARNEVEEELGQSCETNPLSCEEAEEIAKNKQKEIKWLKGSKKIILGVLANLREVRKDVCEDEPSFLNELPNFDDLIDKLQTDYISVLDERITEMTKPPSCTFLDAQSSDESETDEPSDHEKSGKDSSKCLEQVSEKESNYGVETGDQPDRHQRQMKDFKLLYKCTLLLQKELDDVSNICNYIIKVTMCKVKM